MLADVVGHHLSEFMGWNLGWQSTAKGSEKTAVVTGHDPKYYVVQLLGKRGSNWERSKGPALTKCPFPLGPWYVDILRLLV